MNGAVVSVNAAAVVRSRWQDYRDLVKPRIAMMVLFTVGVGYLLAAGRDASLLVLLHALIGVGLTATSANALNQWIERHSDARMKRTADRPLPSGRMKPLEVLVLGSLFGAGGIAYLAATVPHPSAAIVAAVTLVTYVGVYTPLKSVTPLNTLVGAFPGALPPVIGWCAAGGTIDAASMALFGVLFVWQVPHFLAIAWIYRADYAAGGQQMLPVVDRDGSLTARVMVGSCGLLVLTGFGPTLAGLAGVAFSVGAVGVGLWFLASTLRFARTHADTDARRVLRRSLVYLAGVYALLIVDALIPKLLAG